MNEKLGLQRSPFLFAYKLLVSVLQGGYVSKRNGKAKKAFSLSFWVNMAN